MKTENVLKTSTVSPDRGREMVKLQTDACTNNQMVLLSPFVFQFCKM